MAKPTRIRNHGAIPERRHDAFLLALLIAVAFNTALFALQSIMPLIAMVMNALTPPAVVQEEETLPFELVDPSWLTEDIDPDAPVQAESTISREARQVEAQPDLPEGFATVEDGVEEYLTAPDGDPGLAVMPTGDQTVELTADPGDVADDFPDQQADDAVDNQIVEPVEASVPDTPAETFLPDVIEAPRTGPVEPVDDTPSDEPVDPADAPMADLDPTAGEPEEPQDSIPDDAIDQTMESDESHRQIDETIDEPDSIPDVTGLDFPDLASLPTDPDGLLDPQTRQFREIAEAMQQPAEPPAAPAQPEQFAQPEAAQSPSAPEQPRRRPAFRRIGEPGSAGGAPPRRNTSSSTSRLDMDASMQLMMHRYGPYMQKLWEQLQSSLLRQMILNPQAYTRGQVKLRFGISPDGTLTYQEILFPLDGTMVAEQVMSEQMLREAAPFDPLTEEMQRDVMFQRMTVIVNLY